MRKAVIFDLDGTLTQSEEGIFNCAIYAAEKMGYEAPDATTLRRFIGPPLAYSFKTFMGMSEENAQEAVRIYRERYTVTGLFENRVYPGIRRLLRTLKAQGCWCAIATGKPQGPAQRIAEYFGLMPYLDRVIGPDDSAPEKDRLIRAALPDEWDEAWMVGDRRFDIEGGIAVGVKTVGAGWGYGSEEELRSSGCDYYCPDVQSAIDLLCGEHQPPKGFFISIEGLDGSGKTTQVRLLKDALDRFGYEVVSSREPGGTPISEKIRDILLDPVNTAMTDECEAILYAGSRAQHVREVIRPTVKAGKVLFCDRFLDSSVAYQGGGRQLGVDHVLQLNASAVDGTMPLLTVYLDINHEQALKRRANASELDRMEREADSFHARVEQAYRELISRDPQRFVVVDASEVPEEIGKKIAQQVIGRLMEAEKHG